MCACVGVGVLLVSCAGHPHSGIQGLAPVWHGTSESVALKIAANGFVNVKFNPNDKGYFGNGIYVTPQPRYAAAYVTGTQSALRVNVTLPTFACISHALRSRVACAEERCCGVVCMCVLVLSCWCVVVCCWCVDVLCR
jgi:hypothetical protein